MTGNHELALYDANFYRWLDSRATRAAAYEEFLRPHSARKREKVDLNALLRLEFSPRLLARLNALGLAT